jgi:hypothetical protein
MNKRIFLFLLGLFSGTFAMDLNNPEELVNFLTSSPIQPIIHQGSIYRFKIFNHTQNKNYNVGFFNYASENKPLLLTFLQENIEENNLSSAYFNYELLYASLCGHSRNFIFCEKKAKIDKTHKGFYPSIFNLQAPNKKLLTCKDLLNGWEYPLYLVKAPHDFCGGSKYNWNVLDFALHRYNLNILKEIITLNPEFLTPSDKQKGEILLQHLKDEQNTLQTAQKNNTIPMFTLEPNNNDSISPLAYQEIESDYDPAQQLHVFITPDVVKIKSKTDPSTWNYTYPDIDTLRKLYTHIISSNKIEGKNLVKNFSSFPQYPLFYNHFLSYFIDFLECQFYRNDPLIPDNLITLSQHIAQHQHSHEFFKAKEELFFETLARFMITQKKDPRGEAPWDRASDKLLTILVQKPHTKELLIKLCQKDPKLLAPPIKSFFQKVLLRNFLAHTLGKSTPPLPYDVAQKILESWEPDEKFKNCLKPSKITAIPNFF